MTGVGALGRRGVHRSATFANAGILPCMGCSIRDGCPCRCCHSSSWHITVFSRLRLLLHLRRRCLPPSTPIPVCVTRELGHERGVRMPGRTRSKTRTMRDIAHGETHRIGLSARMSPGAHTFQMTSKKSMYESLASTACHRDPCISQLCKLLTCPHP